MKGNIRKSLREALDKHIIKSEKYWLQVLKDSPYAMKVLRTIMDRQDGVATLHQMNILRRAERGDKTPYPTKN